MFGVSAWIKSMSSPKFYLIIDSLCQWMISWTCWCHWVENHLEKYLKCAHEDFPRDNCRLSDEEVPQCAWAPHSWLEEWRQGYRMYVNFLRLRTALPACDARTTKFLGFWTPRLPPISSSLELELLASNSHLLSGFLGSQAFGLRLSHVTDFPGFPAWRYLLLDFSSTVIMWICYTFLSMCYIIWSL